MITRKPDKLKNLILYVAERHEGAPNFDKVRLAKILFWADFRSFAQTGDAITGQPYIRLPQGPVPDHFDDVLHRMQARNELTLVSESVGSSTQPRPVACVKPDLSLFSPAEMDIINAVIDEQYSRTAGEVSNDSPEFLGWRVARDGERIPYGSAWVMDPQPEPNERAHEIAREIAARRGRL